MEPAAARAFVKKHTALARVPLVPEIRLFTATEIVPLWHVTEAWLAARGVAVPFWSVPWAGGQALARYVLDRPATVRDRRVLDFGTGSGLVAIAAALAGARTVRAIDVDPLAAAAATLNAAANGVEERIEIAISAESALDAGDADVVLAGDVWYERAPAARIEAWLAGVARSGATVLTGDPGRAYAPRAATELARSQVPTTLELESAPARTTRVLEIR